MRLRTRFRVSVAASILAVLAVGGLTIWSLRQASQASNAADLALALQRDVFDRVVLRDEFLLYREARARSQIREKTERLLAALQRAATLFSHADERRVVASMWGGVERTRQAFLALAGTPDDRTLAGEERELAAALRERLTSDLVLLSYDLSTDATRLVELASAREASSRRVAVLLALALMVTVLGITLANAALIGGFLQQRIARLHEGTERFASGDLGYRVAMTGDDELADLAHAFNAMAGRLEDGRAVLAGEVEERRRAQGRLETANRELEAFSYSVSHDLRAPLRHITGFVNLLRERAGTGLDGQSQHYLEVISRAAERMGALIDDLLGFSRMSRAELRVDHLELRPLLDDALRDLAGELEGREIAWTIGPLPSVAGDAAMLRQVWFNLVANALKFSRPRRPARIEIGGESWGAGEVRCFVRDNGVGFDPRYADKLFGVFQRLHDASDFEGTGIGLANVKRIVARHGGHVWAEGKPDEGAVFWFALPRGEGS